MTKFISPFQRFSPQRGLVIAGATAALGVVLVVAILAAGAAALFEPENGTRTAGATVVTVTGASGGHAIQFGPAGATPTPAPTSTPAPTPTSTPSNNKNCVTSPHVCGYPDATNTGWQPTGVTLTPDGTPGQTYYITTAGTVIDGKDIHACIFVMAKNVTIKRSKISCSNQPMVKTYEPDGHGGLTNLADGLVIQDTEFDGLGDPDSTTIEHDNYTMLRNNIHNVGSGARVGNNDLLQDNYVHDIATTATTHNGGLPVDEGSNNIIRHNTVLMNVDNGYVIASYNQIPAGNNVSNITIDNNLLAGGNYIIYCGAPGSMTPNLHVTSNRISKLYYANGGYYGPGANCAGSPGWTGNIWDNDLSTVTP